MPSKFRLGPLMTRIFNSAPFKIVELIKRKIGYEGKVFFNRKYPNGTPRKLMDVTKIHKLGWEHQISFEEGIDQIILILKEELQKIK